LNLGHGRWRHRAPAQRKQKFFAPLFFKKAAAFKDILKQLAAFADGR
jgi:hypothetical protein